MKKTLGIALALILSAFPALGQFPQTGGNLKLSQPPVGSPNWGPAYNNNLSTIDSSVTALQNAYQGNWSSSQIYSKGQIVTYSGTAYMSIAANNLNKQPDISASFWGLLASSTGSNVPAPGVTGTAPVSNGTIYTAQGVVLATGVGIANGVSPLDANVKVPLANLYPCAASGSGHSAGTVPDPGATVGTTRYLREDCTWVAVTSGSNGIVTSPKFALPFYNTSGTGNTVVGDTVAKTDGNGNYLLASIAAANSFLGLQANTAMFFSSTNYQPCSADGVSGCSGNNTPFGFVDTINQRFNGGIGQSGPQSAHNVLLQALSGGENANNIFANFSVNGTDCEIYTPGQIGGCNVFQLNQRAVGDAVLESTIMNAWGCSRLEDECMEAHRDFYGFLNPNAGGNVTLGLLDVTGHQAISMAPFGGYSNQHWGDQNVILDVSKRVQLGNVTGNAHSSWDTGGIFITVALDTPHSLGVSSKAFLAAPVDGNIYTGTCPTHTASGQTFPNGDAWVTLPNGQGQKGFNGNYDTTSGALTGYCFSLTGGTTSGLTPGKVVSLADAEYTQEYVTVIAVPDSTHFTAFVHHNHPTGALVSWGGGVQWAFGMNSDERAVNFSSTTNSTQSAILRLGYPIIATDDSTHITLFVNANQSEGQGEFKTLGYNAVTPVQPIDIEAGPVVGGVLQSITYDQSATNSYVTFAGGAGTPGFPPPALTYSGCTTAPVITFAITIPNSASARHYTPTLVSGGAGCPSSGLTITPQATFANPGWVMPASQVNKVIDPATLTVGDGNLQLQAPIPTAATGDELAEGMFWGRYWGERKILNGDPIMTHSGNFGARSQEYYTFDNSRLAYKIYTAAEPSNFIYGTEANNWNPVNSWDARDAVGSVLAFDGVQNGFQWALPPVSGYPGANLGEYNLRLSTDGLALGTAGAPPTSGALLNVLCSSNIEHPCAFGLNAPYDLLFNQIGVPLHLIVDPANGSLTDSGDLFVAGNFQSTSQPGHGVISNGMTLIDQQFNGSTNLWMAGLHQGQGISWSPPFFPGFGFFNGIFMCSFSQEFSDDNALGVGNCNTTSGGDNSDGELMAGSLLSNSALQSPNISAAYHTPTIRPNATYSGASGAEEVWKVSYTALFPNGASSTFGDAVVFTTAALSNSNTITVTCPESLQMFYPVGTVYQVALWNNSAQYFNYGTCPLGNFVTIDGTATQSTFPNVNWTSSVGAIAFDIGPGGVVGFHGDINGGAPWSGISSPSAGVIDFGNGTKNDVTATINAATLNVSGFGTSPAFSASAAGLVPSSGSSNTASFFLGGDHAFHAVPTFTQVYPGVGNPISTGSAWGTSVSGVSASCTLASVTTISFTSGVFTGCS